MKWAFLIPDKAKIAVILTIIVALVITSNMGMRRDIRDIDKSFTSIYNDRQMPAAEFFYITENPYQKRLLL